MGINKIDKKRITTIGIISVILLLIIIFILFKINKKIIADYYTLKPIDINYSILANCIVEYPDPLDITISTQSQVKDINTREGAQITKGQKLMQFDDFTDRQNLKISYNNLITAQLKLKNAEKVELPKLKETLNIDKINLDQAKKNFDRLQDSFKSGGVAQADVEQAENNYKKALAQFNQTQLSLDSFSNSGTLAELSKQVNINQAQYELAKKNVDEKTIIAPFNGTVLKINVQAGQKVDTGEIIMTLIEKKNWILVLNIDQKELGFLKIGLNADVVFEAYPDKKIKAETVYICTEIDKEKGTCEIRLEIKDNEVPIKHGMTGNAEIAAANFTNVLAVPSHLIKKQDEGEFIYIWDSNQIKKVDIKGKIVGEKWRIIDNLASGSIILDLPEKKPTGQILLGKEINAL